MFTIFLTDLDFDQYKEAMYIINGVTVRYSGYTCDLASYSMDVDINDYDEFERIAVALTREDIPFEY